MSATFENDLDLEHFNSVVFIFRPEVSHALATL